MRLFDDWARDYERSVRSSASTFPFDGYERVLDEITRLAGAHAGMHVLDLGIGTGNLAVRFAALGCIVCGIDFSFEMLAHARVKVPQAKLVQADWLADWSVEFNERFDRIVSAYVLHEFDLATKVRLLQRLSDNHLATGGRTVIGDVAFPTVQAREEAHRRWAHLWDEDEHYWAADETTIACQSAGLDATYVQISSCGGVFVIKPKSKIVKLVLSKAKDQKSKIGG